jgi:hypothetical protein
MLTILICVLIGAAINIYREWEDWGWDIILIQIGILGGLAGFVVGVVVAIILPAHYQTDKWSENLANLNDGSHIKGSFFLGSGQIEGRMTYAYYTQNQDSTFKLWQTEADVAIIKYSEGDPKIHITYVHPSERFINLFAIDLDDSNWSCVFEVPKGSIKTNYDLDAQ